MKEREKKGYIIHRNSKWEEKRLLYSFVEDFKKNNAYDAAKKIAIPTLIVHWNADTIVPIEQSKKLAKNLKKGKIEIITGADHKYIKQHEFEKMIEIIYKFVIENI
jgi:dipeptidyl aminopeptidase/acylaminoacyl peptidase